MSVGNYTRTIHQPSNEFDTRVRAFRDGSVGDLPNTFENWDAEHVREAVAGIQRADTNKIAQRANADKFLSLHPEFVDVQANGETMNRTLEALYGDRVYTVDEFEKAYQVCCANKSLQLDQAEIAKQQQAAADERAQAAKEQRARETRVVTEDERYSMSLDELRQLENREIRQRAQRIGEEGGW